MSLLIAVVALVCVTAWAFNERGRRLEAAAYAKYWEKATDEAHAWPVTSSPDAALSRRPASSTDTTSS